MLSKFRKWLYEFKYGHPFLLEEEVDVICKTREELNLKHLNDREIQMLIAVRINEMYNNKFPDAKRWSLRHLKKK